MKQKRVWVPGSRLIKTVLLAALMILALPVTAKAGMHEEQNVSRYVMLDLDGGSTTWSGWACWVDRNGKYHNAGLNWWFIPGSGNIAPNDVTNIPNWSAGNKTNGDDKDRNRFVLRPGVWEHQYMDCVGMTPYIACDTPTRSGYTFKGWTTSGTVKPVEQWGAGYGWRWFLNVGAYSGNAAPNGTWITMKALWQQNEFTLTYNGNGGTPSKTNQKAKQNEAWGTLATATRAGYTFDGWYTGASGGTKVTASTICKGNTTVYAHWTANTYTMTYDKNNPKTALVPDDIVLERTSQTGRYDSPWGTLSTASKQGYTFDGWYTAATGGTKVTAATVCKGDMTVYAHWTANTYTLTYVENNPITALTDDITLSRASQTAVFDTPWGDLATGTKPGYIFQGWYTDSTGGTKIGAETICKGDLTVYAHWKPITYLIRFHPNAEHGLGEVSGAMASITLTYDQAMNLPVNQYGKMTAIPSEDEGGTTLKRPAVFMGWSLNPESLVPAWADQAKILNLTKREGDVFDLYAIWDDAPTFQIDEYPDRYFTLEEAKNGVVTEDELLRTVIVYDRESNLLPKKDSDDVANSGTDVGVTVVGYDKSEFEDLDDDATILVRYKVKDDAGNETYLNINVEVTRNGKLPNEDITYYRSISKDYKDKGSHEGGLADDSYWRQDGEAYGRLLADALQDNPTALYDLTLGKNLLSKIRIHVKDNGFGNSEGHDDLRHVWTLLGEEAE